MTDPKAALKESIVHQRESLTRMLQSPLYEIAEACSRVWPDRPALNDVLREKLELVPNCKYLYVLNTEAIQISDNVSRDGVISNDYGRDRSERPYMCEVVPSSGFLLSDTYISLRAHRPSLTAIQLVRDSDGKALGFVGADFDLRDLPLTRKLYDEPRYWQQIKGDPSIRGTVFHQSRVDSDMDKHLDTILSVIEELMTKHGVYHVILHFSSSRAIIWQMEDPYRYRLLDIDSLIDPDICLAYPHHAYSREAAVPANQIHEVLEAFRQLRFMDDTFYLRSGTLNIFNGLVGLTFSCDGSHYIPYDEFLDKEHAFWSMQTAN